MSVREDTIKMLEQTQQSFLTAAEDARLAGGHTDTHDLLASTIPHLPGLIEQFVPAADAVIMTKDSVRAMLAEFASSVAFVQSGILKNQTRRKKKRAAK